MSPSFPREPPDRVRHLRGMPREIGRGKGRSLGPRLERNISPHLVEQRRDGEEFGTVHANVACPSEGLVSHACGGFPAASAGTWHRSARPW